MIYSPVPRRQEEGAALVRDEQLLHGEFLTPAELAKLNQISTPKAVFAVVFQWVVIAIAIAASMYFNGAFSAHTHASTQIHTTHFNWIAYLAAVILIGSRQHALAILMHEAVHLHLFKGPRFGYFISQIFLAFPTGISTSVYRHKHLQHHRFVNTDQDPDYAQQKLSKEWRWPKSKKEAFILFVRDLLGLNLHDSFKIFNYWSPVPVMLGKEKDKSLIISRNERILYFAFNIAAIAAVVMTGTWKEVLLYWYVPLLTYLSFAARVRAATEHNGLKMSFGELGTTRHIEANWLERIFISPCNINHHLAHHLYPSIPHYNLPAATKAIFAKPGVVEFADITYGYFNSKTGALNKIIKAPPAIIYQFEDKQSHGKSEWDEKDHTDTLIAAKRPPLK